MFLAGATTKSVLPHLPGLFDLVSKSGLSGGILETVLDDVKSGIFVHWPITSVLTWKKGGSLVAIIMREKRTVSVVEDAVVAADNGVREKRTRYGGGDCHQDG